MKRLLLLFILLFPVVVAAQSRTSERVVTVPFSQLKSTDPNGSERHVISASADANGVCIAGTGEMFAVKLSGVWRCFSGSNTGGVPAATYITQTANSTLTNEQALGALSTGILKSATGSGVVSIAVPNTDYLTPTGNGSGLTNLNASNLNSGTVGLARGGTNQSSWTASRCVQVNSGGTALESASATCGGGAGDVTGAASSTDSELPLFSSTTGKVLKRSNTLSGYVKVASGVVSAAVIPVADLPSFTSAQFAALVTDETGSGAVVLGTSPTIVTPTIGSFVNANHGHQDAAGGGQLVATSVFASGTVPTARLGSGSATSSTFLRGDQTWATITGTGDVVGPGSATDNALVRFDLTTGKLVQNSAATVDDSGNLATLSFATTSTGAGTLSLGDTDGSHVLAITPGSNLTANRTFTITTGDASRTVTYTGDPTLSDWFDQSVKVAANPQFATIELGHASDTTLSRSAAGTVQIEGVTVSTASNTVTLTGKSLDVEGTGNVFGDVHKLWLPFAGCNNATAAFMWDVPTSLAPTAACVTGSNTQKGTADWPDSDGDYNLQNSLLLPSFWTGTVDVRIRWYSTTATSGDVVWQVQTICVADGETDDPAWNTASTVVDTAKGTTSQMNDATITGLTITGCAAGEMMHVRVLRNRTHGSDTIAGIIRGVGAEFTTRSSK